LLDIDLKIILFDCQNNYVGTLKINVKLKFLDRLNLAVYIITKEF